MCWCAAAVLVYSLKYYSSEVAIVYASLRFTFGPCQQRQQHSVHYIGASMCCWAGLPTAAIGGTLFIPAYRLGSTAHQLRKDDTDSDVWSGRIDWLRHSSQVAIEGILLFIYLALYTILLYEIEIRQPAKKYSVYIYVYILLYTSAVWVKFVVMVTCQVCREKEKKCWEKRDPSFPSGLLLLLSSVFFFFFFFFLLFWLLMLSQTAVALSLIFFYSNGSCSLFFLSLLQQRR